MADCAFCGEVLGKARFCPRCGILRSDRDGTVVRARRWPRIGALAIDVGLMVVTLLAGWLVWFAATSRAGQSPGKRLLGLRVVNTDGTVAKPGKMVLRFVVTVVVMGWLDYLIAFFNKDSRTLHDYVCRTLVVNAVGSEKLLRREPTNQQTDKLNPVYVRDAVLGQDAPATMDVASGVSVPDRNPVEAEASYQSFDFTAASLNRLKFLHSQKLITDAEYEARRQAVLDQ